MKRQLLKNRQCAASSGRNILSTKVKSIIFYLCAMVFISISFLLSANKPNYSPANFTIASAISESINNKYILLPGDSSVYAGSKVCLKCHAEYMTGSAHASTLTDAHITPQKIVAPLASDSPVHISQIAYTIGAGRGQQRYCDTSFKMLPFRWNVTALKWESEAVKDAVTNCMACHATGYNADTEKWSEFGVTCEACHGPGSLHSEKGDKSKILNLKNLPFDRQSMVCGQCHSAGKHLSGAHPFPTEFHPGDDLNKVFIIDKNRQGSEYSELINSRHLENDVICTVCHNPHGPVEGTLHQLRSPVNELCMECHNDKTLSEHAPDAAAGTTCATCHMPGGSHQFTIPQLK